MAHYRDLADWDYLGRADGQLLAVGWLEPGHEYTKGAVSAEVFQALVALLVNPWQPVASAGMQRCPFCRFTGGPAEIRYGGTAIQLGVANLFVPGDGCVLVAPSLIAHYIDAHEYAPPVEFQRAVLESPLMRSVAYLRRLHEHGIHKLGVEVR